MRLVVGVLFALLLIGCDPIGRLPDGEQIDGIWVGAGAACQDGDDPGLCEAILACAIENEFGGVDPGIESWQVHGPPERNRDGTLRLYGGNVVIVVFEQNDGTRRATQVAETDRCR